MKNTFQLLSSDPMSENTIIWLCIGGVILFAVLVVVLANYLTARNNQKRAAVAEIQQYDVEWKRHHMELHVKERNEDGNR